MLCPRYMAMENILRFFQYSGSGGAGMPILIFFSVVRDKREFATALVAIFFCAYIFPRIVSSLLLLGWTPT